MRGLPSPRRRWLRVLGAFGCSVLLAACAEIQHVGVASRPEGATVYLNGEVVGQTPLRLTVPRREAHAVYVKKDGFLPELVVLDTNQDPEGLPFLTPADVRVQLRPRAGGRLDTRDLEIEVEE